MLRTPAPKTVLRKIEAAAARLWQAVSATGSKAPASVQLAALPKEHPPARLLPRFVSDTLQRRELGSLGSRDNDLDAATPPPNGRGQARRRPVITTSRSELLPGKSQKLVNTPREMLAPPERRTQSPAEERREVRADPEKETSES